MVGVMGYFSMTCSVPKRAVAAYVRLGLSVSYNSIVTMSKRISACIHEEYKEMVKEEVSVWVWDNLNRTYDVAKRTLTKTGHMSHETQPFVAFLPPSLPAATRSHLEAHNIDRQAALDLQSADLVPDMKELKERAKVHFFEVLWKHHKHAMRVHLAGRNRPQMSGYFKIDLSQTRLYPLPTLDLDEAKTEDTLRILEAVEDELQLPGSFFEAGKFEQMTAGDLLTFKNTTRAMYQRTEALSFADSKNYFEPVFGMFHYCMAAQRAIVKNYWLRDDGKDIISIARYAALIRDNKIDPKCKDYRSTNYFLDDLLDGHILATFMSQVKVKTPDELNKWLRDEKNANRWKAHVSALLNNVFDPTAIQKKRFHPTTGEGLKNPGPIAPSFEEGGLAQTDEEIADGPGLRSYDGKYRDVAMENAILFMRDMLVYREMRDAIE